MAIIEDLSFASDPLTEVQSFKSDWAILSEYRLQAKKGSTEWKSTYLHQL